VRFLSIEGAISRERYRAAEDELRTDANTHYQTTIGLATHLEIIATVLTVVVVGITFLLGAASRSNDI
jgi:hypothetical protein